MMRCRFLYEKRGRLCFVPHVEMPPLLCRTFRRSGYLISRSESLVPKDKISLGPPLPMGVAGLAEPAEIWLDEKELPDVTRLDSFTHDGLKFLFVRIIEEGPGLSRLCKDGGYRVYPKESDLCARFRSLLSEGWKPVTTTLWAAVRDSYIDIGIGDANQVGPGTLVSSMKAEGLVSGWEDLFIVRTVVGVWDGNRIVPALKAGDGS